MAIQVWRQIFRSSKTHKNCPKTQRIIHKPIIHEGWGTSKLGVAPKVGEKKGVALKVGEKAASHLTPLHAPGLMLDGLPSIISFPRSCQSTCFLCGAMQVVMIWSIEMAYFETGEMMLDSQQIWLVYCSSSFYNLLPQLKEGERLECSIFLGHNVPE